MNPPIRNVQGSKPVVFKTLILILSAVASLFVARADSLTWDPNHGSGSGGTGTWYLNGAPSWWNGSADVTWSDNTANGTNTAVFSGTSGTVTVGSSLSASNLQFQAPGYTLSGSSTLTLGAGGIDASALSSGTTTIGVPLSLAVSQQSWLVGSGSTLAVNGAISRAAGATVDFAPSGTTSTTLANANGILGGWATVGGANSTGGDWAANDGAGNIVTYTGYTDVSGQTTTGAGASAQNWENATATTTLSASATVNSLNQLNDFTVNAGCTLTLGSGGLVLGNVSRWMLAGSTTTSLLESGAASGELFVHVPDSGSGGNWTIWPLVADNGATPLILVKDGAGLVKLANNNSYTGGTIVNGGTLAARCAVNPGATTQFGTGNVTVNSGAQLELGTDIGGNAFTSFHYPNNISVNGGGIFAWDASHRIQGNLNIGPAGLSVGSTFDAPWENLSEPNFPKALFFDGLITGTGPLTVEDSPYGQTGNAWNTSCTVFTSSGTAAQNTYSGTVTVNPLTITGSGGGYLYLVGPTVMANATINLTGDNLAASGRMGTNSLLFGNGSLDGTGSCTIGALTGTGDVLLNDTILFTGGSGYSNGIPVALTVGNNNSSTTYSGILSGSGSLIKTGTGTLTLSGVNSYAGDTTVNGGALIFTAAFVHSTNITVGQGATLDVSALGSVSLTGFENLYGGGTINGSVNTSSGSAVYAGTDGGYGTNVISGSLSLAPGATVHLDLGTAHNGQNDLITVGGTLSANNTIIHLKAPSTAANLDATADYVLLTSSSTISGTFSSAPTWDVAPANAAHYSIVTSGNTVVLHYAVNTSPSGNGTATPSSALRNQTVGITVTANNGTGGTVNSVTVDTSSIGGSSSLALISAGGNVWTNSIAVAPATPAGAKTLPATIQDTASLTAIANVSLTVNVGNDVWNGAGANNNFSTGLNWANQFGPGYVGDSLEFAGTARLAPNMDNNYTITGVTFDSGAGSFNIASANNSTLTLGAGATLVNNSANPQTLNVPIADAGGGLIKGGSGSLTLAAANTYTGPTTINAGTLNLSGSLASTASLYIGNAAGNSALGISGTVSPYYMLAGNVTNAVTAIYQSAGTVTATANSGYDNLSLGNVGGSYGYYGAFGGSANIGGIAVAGEDNTTGSANFNGNGGNGILDINGANIQCSGWFVVARCANPQIGIVNLYSGSLTYAGGGMICNWGSGQTTMINVMGGTLSTATANEIGFLNGKGIVNLLGGVVSVPAINGGWDPANGQICFNGGTLQAAAGTSQLLAVTTATIFSGGATIDNNGNTVGLGQSLLAPAGNGISAVTFSGGAGYIAPPIVIVTPGSGDTTGTGATAIAQINTTTGTVTNILITCPGVNYTATPTFNFSGGGATTQASVTGVTLKPNTDGGLTSIGTGTLVFTNANTYTGPTLVNAGTLYLGAGGSIDGSTNIVTSAGAIFDVSIISYTVGGNQALSGFGNVNGSVNTSAGSKILGGTDGTYGTNTFNNDLTLASGAACYLDLGTTYNGANDQLVVGGTLTANGNVIHIKAPSTSSSLDTSDYTLITAGAISGTFASAPAWDVTPANAGHYTIVTSGNTVTLHYNAAAAAPVVAASANPSTLVRNQPFLITANVTPGSAPISTVTVDLTPLGGSVVSLIQSGASTTYTNTVAVPATANPGGATLTVTATDTAAQTGSSGVTLTVNTSTEVWNGNGGNANWSTNPNWVSGYAPGYAGDTLVFAGSTTLAPSMNANYSATGLSFSNNAGAFTIGTANSSTLSLTANGLENDSANAQTVNVPITLTTTEPINAASGNIGISSTLSGAGGITKIGNNALTLSGNGSSLGGPLSVNAGSLNIPGGSAAFTGNPSRIGYLTGTGALNMTGGTLSNSGDLQVGSSDQNGAGINAVGSVTLANSTLSVGKLTIARGNNPLNTVSGTVTLNSGSTLNCEGDVLLDFAGGVLGKLVLNGGTLNHATTTKRWLIMSQWDSGSAEVDVNSGQLNINANTDIRFAISGNTGTNTFNLNGGAVTFYSDNATTVGGSGVVDMHQGNGTTVNNIFNLNGGTLTVSQILSANTAGTRAFNFNGGTLKATAANSSYLSLGSGNASANVRNGGAIIDDGGFAIGIPQPLQHSTIAGDNSIDGGLTKKGAGTLTLSGGTSYTGNTTVSAGTLELSLATLATGSTVSISNGAVLKLDFTTTNQVAGLVLNGVSQPAGVYSSTTSPSYITGTGSLVVVAAVPPQPTFGKITLSGGNIIITATNNNGNGGTWTLLGTNNLTAPLSTWPPVTNGTFVNGQLAITNAVGTNRGYFILRVP